MGYFRSEGEVRDMNILKELCKSKVQTGTVVTPTIVESRMINLTGGYVTETHGDLIIDPTNYYQILVYFYLNCKYAGPQMAHDSVYGAQFQDVPGAFNFGRGYEMGAQLICNDQFPMDIYKDPNSGIWYAQLTPVGVDIVTNTELEIYGFYTSKQSKN